MNFDQGSDYKDKVAQDQAKKPKLSNFRLSSKEVKAVTGKDLLPMDAVVEENEEDLEQSNQKNWDMRGEEGYSAVKSPQKFDINPEKNNNSAKINQLNVAKSD